MINDVINNLESLKDSELEEKIQDLTRKYYTAYRLGKPDLLTQISNFITIYKEEMSRRYLSKNNGNNEDLDQLINVD